MERALNKTCPPLPLHHSISSPFLCVPILEILPFGKLFEIIIKIVIISPNSPSSPPLSSLLPFRPSSSLPSSPPLPFPICPQYHLRAIIKNPGRPLHILLACRRHLPSSPSTFLSGLDRILVISNSSFPPSPSNTRRSRPESLGAIMRDVRGTRARKPGNILHVPFPYRLYPFQQIRDHGVLASLCEVLVAQEGGAGGAFLRVFLQAQPHDLSEPT